MTRFAEVIGDPIAHSKSPLIHGFWLHHHAIAADYRKTHVLPADLGPFFGERRNDPAWRGCNVTVPHKQTVIPFLDHIDPLAAQVGAVNTIAPRDGGLHGYNTDVAGFAEPLPDLTGKSAIMVGAGGGARAVLIALRQASISHVTVMNRNVAKAQGLLDEQNISGSAIDLSERPSRADFLVNASTLGMVGHPPLPPGLAERINPHGTVYDIVYAPLETTLLADARARGLVAIDGLAMLIGQAAAAFALFFGVTPDRTRDAELRALLTA